MKKKNRCRMCSHIKLYHDLHYHGFAIDGCCVVCKNSENNGIKAIPCKEFISSDNLEYLELMSEKKGNK